MQTTTLPIPPGWFGVLAFVLAVLLVAAYLPDSARKMPAALDRFRMRLGYKSMDGGLFLLLTLLTLAAGALWACVAGYLLYGLLGLAADLTTSPPPPMAPETEAGKQALWNWRFELAQLAALTTLLTAVIALPITLNRLRLTRQQTRIADESLFNQKITEAAADLHAQRQVTWPGALTEESPKTGDPTRTTAPFNAWEDDVVRRNAAIDRLEGLLRERSEVTPDIATAERIARLLSVYLRELSREHPAEEHAWMQVRALTHPQDDSPPLTQTEALTQLGLHPDNASLAALKRWAFGLHIRSDMQNAAQTLGRLTQTCGLDENALLINLSDCNLQGVAMISSDFRDATFIRAEMQGADLRWAEMQGANFHLAKMQGANFQWANLPGANFRWAKMHGADLRWAKLQGANLSDANISGADFSRADMHKADLSDIQMLGANLSEAHLQNAKLSRAHMQGAYLGAAEMHGADLNSAKMREADLRLAKLKGTDLSSAEMQGANLRRVEMQGAYLFRTEMDDQTDLNATNLRGAALRSVDDTTIAKLQPFWQEIFADGTVRLPDGETRPDHWADEKLDWDDFKAAWHKWMREEMGMDPDNPQ